MSGERPEAEAEGDRGVREAPGADGATAFGWTWHDPALLQAALTHRSYVNEHADAGDDNERLEFLGDAVLGYVVGERLFRAAPAADEGELTRLRAAIVCQASLARFAARLGIGDQLRLGRGEAAGGGRQRPALLCAAFEAVLGAAYLDGGLAACGAILDPLLAPELSRAALARRGKDARSQFQERVQARWKVTPRYEVTGQLGPDHAKRFVVEVRVGDRTWSRGEGRSKSEAAQAAAEAGLAALDAHDARERAAARAATEEPVDGAA